MDLSELGWHCPVSSKQGNYPYKEAAETLNRDGFQNISSSRKKPRKHTLKHYGQCHHKDLRLTSAPSTDADIGP